MKQKIIDSVLFIIVLVWCFATMCKSCNNPVDPYNFTVEEQIRYERMIF